MDATQVKQGPRRPMSQDKRFRVNIVDDEAMRWSPGKSCRSAAAASCTNFTTGGFQPKIPWKFLANVLFLVDGGPPRKMKNLYRINASVH